MIDQGESIGELKSNLEEGVRFYLETQRLLFKQERPSAIGRREVREVIG